MSDVDLILDRSSPVPLYHQLASGLEEAIRDGRLAPEAKLENEIALAERYNVSRPTVRQAMDKLVQEGLVVRRRGVGTQVVGPRLRRRLKLSSLYSDLQEAGATPRTSVLDLEVVRADDTVRDRLDLPPGSEVHHLRRLRIMGDEPLGVMENWIPRSVAGLSESALEQDGLYNVLRRTGVEFQMAHQTVGATVADAEQARLLGIGPGAPLVTVQRVAWDARGAALEYGSHVYRADLYTYETTLTNR